MSLERRTPLRKKRPTPRRKPLFTCDVRGCNKPPRFFGECALHARKTADRIFALYIRARDRRCQVCRSNADLQCAHLISRRYMAVRWSPDNAVALCVFDHKRFTENPLAWDAWCEERLTEPVWRSMKFRALRGGMPDLGVVIADLRRMLEEVAA